MIKTITPELEEFVKSFAGYTRPTTLAEICASLQESLPGPHSLEEAVKYEHMFGLESFSADVLNKLYEIFYNTLCDHCGEDEAEEMICHAAGG